MNLLRGQVFFASGGNPPKRSGAIKTLLTLLGCFALTAPAFAAGTHLKGEKPLSIAQGAKVDLAEFLVTGRYTVYVFTSEYCGPCRDYDDNLYRLHRTRTDVAVVKVDINRIEVHKIDWQSPVAEQYNIHTVPFFVVCGPDGKLLVNGEQALALVDGWIRQLPH